MSRVLQESIVKDVEVSVRPDRRVHLDVELPPDFPVGKTVAKLIFVKKRPANHMAKVRGMGKGKVWMSNDFDAPLEDFAEYM